MTLERVCIFDSFGKFEKKCLERGTFLSFAFQVAANALESSLIKYSAKEYFFRAALCHLCVDAVNAQHAVERYEEQFPSFGDSRESKLVKVRQILHPIKNYLIISENSYLIAWRFRL